MRAAAARGQVLSPTDVLWLADFDERAKGYGPGKTKEGKNFGASRSGRKVKFELQEEAESVGVGNAAVEAASAALQAKEEGRRLDSLTVNAVGALKEAVACYRDMCLSMRERMEILEATHISMLDAVRDHFIRRTEAEAELLAEQGKDDGANGMLMGLLAQHFGLQLPAAARANGAVPKKPGA